MYRLVLIISLLTLNLFSADWIMIQGTQKENSKDHNLWAFGQLRYIHNYGKIDTSSGINKTPFSMNKPDLEKQDSTVPARLRVGLRGKLDDANKINYFLLTEFGVNGITYPLGYKQSQYLTDASLTLRYLPVDIRLGQFKYPGSEEGLMARFTSPFIQFTTLGEQLMLERFIDPSVQNSTSYLGEPEHSVGAYRDSGIQLSKKLLFVDGHSLTLAYMLGLGAGLQMENVNDSNPTHYLYMAYENILGKKKGYHTESLKLYGWYQNGKRKLYDDLYDRIRYGLGFTYFDNGFRLEGEYMVGEGMIFGGAKDTNTDPQKNDWLFLLEADSENKADGYYILSTYEFYPQAEVLARYDIYNRMTNIAAKKRVFQNTTLGLSYRIKGFNRIDFNYTFADATAPHNDTAQDVVDNMGDILRVQLTLVYK